MASKRLRGDSWEYIIKRAKLLPKPLTLTFKSEAEGDAYCARVEALLDRGIIPAEIQERNRGERASKVQDLVLRYLREAPRVSQKDREQLSTLLKERARAESLLPAVNVAWVDLLIGDMKLKKAAPATIHARVGALARCTDWGVRKALLTLPDNPFRTLPVGYASYGELDAKAAGGAVEDEERDRRLSHDGKEEKAILAVIRSGRVKRKGKEMAFLLQTQHLEVLFLLALETAMRLREMFTLRWDQVRLEKRAVWLPETKNGQPRQVPLSSVAVKLLDSLPRDTDQVFPWWDGEEDFDSYKRTQNKLSKTFADIFETAGCGDLHFHDLRHEATSRLFERTNLPTESVMKITGHKSHRMFMRYLKLRESGLADALW